MPDERPILQCVCGKWMRTLPGQTQQQLADRERWKFYPNSPHKDGTNALCWGCQNDGDDSEDL